MILFSEDNIGRSYIGENLIIKKLYNYLEEENSQIKILSIKNDGSKVKIFLNGSKNLNVKDLIVLQKNIIKFLKSFFNLNIFEVDIEIV